MTIFQRSLAMALATVFLLSGTACSNSKKKKDADLFNASQKSEQQLRAEAGVLYRYARKDLDSGSNTAAIEKYDLLTKQYPFTDFATQGEIERIYALYRTSEPDKAIAAADRFMREHPRNPAIDYVQYLKGLSNYNRDPSISAMVGVSVARSDVGNYRRAFDDFALLVQRYPSSRYYADARERMIYLRNVVAEHEIWVVRFYVDRGAYLAAAKRAEQVIAQFPGSPASHEALALMESSYHKAGLEQQAADARRILQAQPTLAKADTAAVAPSSEAPKPPAGVSTPTSLLKGSNLKLKLDDQGSGTDAEESAPAETE